MNRCVLVPAPIRARENQLTDLFLLSFFLSFFELMQALGQCQRWLKEHAPDAELIKVASTAGAAKMISSREEAAICSRICVDLYDGLAVIAEGLQDENS